MDALYLLLLFPLIWPLLAKRIWQHHISWREMGLNIGIVVVVVTITWVGGRGMRASDTEIWNGQVIGKAKVWTSCEHSYQCNPYPCMCDDKGSCSTCWNTCYDHSNDWNWAVKTDVGDFNIARIDSQGRREPSRWTKVQAGQPVAQQRSFVNYIKAAPDSLFHKKGSLREQFAKHLPAYPHVYDYHYADRVIPVGVKVADIADWNNKLALILRKLGPQKQANVIVVLVGFAGDEYSYALEEHWLGGKKNDVIVVLGVPEYPKVSWARVVSWTDKEIFKVALRDALLDMKTLEADKVISAIERHVTESFVRKPMADFEYLWAEVRPPMWITVLSFMLAIFGSMGLTLVFHRSNI